eukprot:190974-Rhodomonas_salina.2
MLIRAVRYCHSASSSCVLVQCVRYCGRLCCDSLRARYAVSGTDPGYAATILTQAMLLPASILRVLHGL